MAREQLGVSPSRGTDTVDISYLMEQLALQSPASRVVGEVPDGTKDGVNAIFTTANAFYLGTTEVYVNGLREQLGMGYTETAPNVLVLSFVPSPDDDIVVSYVRSG